MLSTRINRSVLSPLFHRVLKAAVGLILRKPIVFDGGDENYFEEWRQNVDREGSSLDEFMGKIVYSSIAYGHCGFLVDFPNNDARNLREERELNAKPYFIMEQAPNIIGWRHGPVQIIKAVCNRCACGNSSLNRRAVLATRSSAKYRVWDEQVTKFGKSQSTAIAIPLIGRVLFLFQKSRLLLFIQRGNRCWCLSHPWKSWRISTFSIINCGLLCLTACMLLVSRCWYLKAWDDNSDTLQNLSVGNALALPPEGAADRMSSMLRQHSTRCTTS